MDGAAYRASPCVCVAVAAALTLLVATGCGDRPEPTSRSPDPDPLTLRVATFNVWAIPFVSDDRIERLARLGPALRSVEPDVLCLQELWAADDQARVRGALEPLLPHAVTGSGGLMLLSRLPIASSRFLRYPSYRGLSLGEQLAGKGILDAVLDTPRGPLRVVTTHLALARGPDNPRSRQLGFLLAHLDAERTMPVVLAGDLNTSPVRRGALTPDYERLLAAGFLDADPPVQGPDGLWLQPAPTRIGWPRPAERTTRGWCADHVLFRSGTTVDVHLESFRQAWDDRATALSDHNLLLATLRLEAAPEEDTR